MHTRKGGVEMANSRFERAVVISDIHIPFEDPKSLKAVLLFLREFKPDVVFLNGDIMDFWAVSDHDKSPRDYVSMNDEFLAGREFLETLRTMVGKRCKIYYTFGNHEYRFERYLMKKAPELYGLEGLDIPSQLRVQDYNVEVIYSGHKENFVQWGDVFVGHWGKAASSGGYAGNSLVTNKMVSCIQGHTHKLGMSYRKGLDGRMYKGVEYGCLCDLNPNWINTPGWVQGFCVMFRDKKTDRVHVTPVPIVQHEFVYNGKLWTA